MKQDKNYIRFLKELENGSVLGFRKNSGFDIITLNNEPGGLSKSELIKKLEKMILDKMSISDNIRILKKSYNFEQNPSTRWDDSNSNPLDDLKEVFDRARYVHCWHPNGFEISESLPMYKICLICGDTVLNYKYFKYEI